MTVILKIGANPRDIGNIWRPRTPEHTGGWNPREMVNLDINPNESAEEGLAHHSRNTTEDTESREQLDPKKRRERAMLELVPIIPHISIKPENMDDMLERSPRMEEENTLLETGLGVDLGARGLSLSAGAHRGSVRSDTPYVTYGRGLQFGKSEELEKAKRRYRGRKYSDDEEDEEEERKSKRSNKRKKKRSGKKGKKKLGGKLKGSISRDPKRTTATSDAGKRRQVDRTPRHQKMGHSLSRKFGLGTHTELPLRLRDPIAYARKLANEKLRRQTGAMPAGMTHHRSSSAGVSSTQTRGGTIGGDKRSTGKGTKMEQPPKVGTSMRAGAKADRVTEPGSGDPLGTEDWMSDKMLKARGGLASLSRTEITGLMTKIERLLRQLEKLTKANPELEAEAKEGAMASENVSSAPQGPTSKRREDEAWSFEDTSINTVANITGKR